MIRVLYNYIDICSILQKGRLVFFEPPPKEI